MHTAVVHRLQSETLDSILTLLALAQTLEKKGTNQHESSWMA